MSVVDESEKCVSSFRKLLPFPFSLGETPYACHLCGRAFTFQQSYHKHMLYHTDEKPYTW